MEAVTAPVRPLGLDNQEAAALLGVSLRKFYQLKRLGTFDGLESPIPGLWSRELLERFMARDLAYAQLAALKRRKAG